VETLETRVRGNYDVVVAGGDYDVVVAGGGASGLTAALAAARSGARTALVERTGCLGGTATAGMVAQWLGFYNRETRVVGGLAMELTRRICALGGSNGFARYTLAEASANPIPLINFPFNPEIVKIASDEAAQEAGVDVQLYTQIVRPLSGDGRVEGVVVENASGRAALRAKIVVDATGDAAVAAASGVPCAGEEADLRQHRQPCTLVFRISNVDVKRFRGIPREVKRDRPEGIGERRLFWEASFCSTRAAAARSPDDGFRHRRVGRHDHAAAMDGRQQVKSIVRFLLSACRASSARCSLASPSGSECAKPGASTVDNAHAGIFSTTSAFLTRSHSAPDRWICTSQRYRACVVVPDAPFGSAALPLAANDRGPRVADRATATRASGGGSRTAMCLGEGGRDVCDALRAGGGATH
jgi:hypothetical protein